MWLAKVFRPYHKRSLAQLRSEQAKVAWLPTILGDLGASCENVTPKHLSWVHGCLALPAWSKLPNFGSKIMMLLFQRDWYYH